MDHQAIAVLVLLALVSPAAYAIDYIVGDHRGWTDNVDYDNWARDKTFRVNDRLIFNYDFSHAVSEVYFQDYQTCNFQNAISADGSSPTTIFLTTPGTRYFICPRSNHCARGNMRLTINTVDANGNFPPGTPGNPGFNPGTPGNPGFNTGNPSGGFFPNGATGNFAAKSCLMAAVPLVVAALF